MAKRCYFYTYRQNIQYRQFVTEDWPNKLPLLLADGCIDAYLKDIECFSPLVNANVTRWKKCLHLVKPCGKFETSLNGVKFKFKWKCMNKSGKCNVKVYYV